MCGRRHHPHPDGDLRSEETLDGGILDLSVEGTMSVQRGQHGFSEGPAEFRGQVLLQACLFLLILWQTLTEGLEVLVSLTHYPGTGALS